MSGGHLYHLRQMGSYEQLHNTDVLSTYISTEDLSNLSQPSSDQPGVPSKNEPASRQPSGLGRFRRDAAAPAGDNGVGGTTATPTSVRSKENLTSSGTSSPTRTMARGYLPPLSLESDDGMESLDFASRGQQFIAGEWDDNAWYVGEGADGAPEGMGVQRSTQSCRYMGMWVGGKENGTGMRSWTDGAVYFGEWREGRMWGAGLLVDMMAGSAYIGDWEDGARARFGVETRFSTSSAGATTPWHNPTATARSGIDLHNQTASQSQLDPNAGQVHTYESIQEYMRADRNVIRRYAGTWNKDKPHGYGVTLTSDGGFYAGQWVSGRRHGLGVMVQGPVLGKPDDEAGSFNGANFYDGPNNGTRVTSMSNLDVLHRVKACLDYLRDGLLVASASMPGAQMIYVGQWSNNLRHGVGSQLFSTGSIYQGEWREDLMHGRGEMMHSDGHSTRVGVWDNDRFRGKMPMMSFRSRNSQSNRAKGVYKSTILYSVQAVDTAMMAFRTAESAEGIVEKARSSAFSAFRLVKRCIQLELRSPARDNARVQHRFVQLLETELPSLKSLCAPPDDRLRVRHPSRLISRARRARSTSIESIASAGGSPTKLLSFAQDQQTTNGSSSARKPMILCCRWLVVPVIIAVFVMILQHHHVL